MAKGHTVCAVDLPGTGETGNAERSGAAAGHRRTEKQKIIEMRHPPLSAAATDVIDARGRRPADRIGLAILRRTAPWPETQATS